MQLRPAVAADAAAILEIYNHQVLTSNVTFDLTPRTHDEQRRWITDRSGAHAAIVAVVQLHGAEEAERSEGAEEVIGFGSLSPYRDRPGYSTSVEDSVYVHPDHQGTGVGAAILSELVERATSHGFHAVFARIVAGHDASIGLHSRLGFEIVGQEKEVGRKFGRFHDVVVMELLL